MMCLRLANFTATQSNLFPIFTSRKSYQRTCTVYQGAARQLNCNSKVCIFYHIFSSLRNVRVCMVSMFCSEGPYQTSYKILRFSIYGQGCMEQNSIKACLVTHFDFNNKPTQRGLIFYRCCICSITCLRKQTYGTQFSLRIRRNKEKFSHSSILEPHIRGLCSYEQ